MQVDPNSPAVSAIQAAASTRRAGHHPQQRESERVEMDELEIGSATATSEDREAREKSSSSRDAESDSEASGSAPPSMLEREDSGLNLLG